MEQEKKCIDLVAEKFAEQEQEYKDARKWYEDFETATEGEQIALKKSSEFQGYDYEYYDDYSSWLYNQFLCFDFVAPFTFGEDQKAGYWRLQISWGGPSSEFRIYADENLNICAVEYWYMDWYDGAYVEVGEDSECFHICEDFIESARY
jgi:hypothetical protein